MRRCQKEEEQGLEGCGAGSTPGAKLKQSPQAVPGQLVMTWGTGTLVFYADPLSPLNPSRFGERRLHPESGLSTRTDRFYLKASHFCWQPQGITMVRNTRDGWRPRREIFPYLLGFHQHLEKHRETPRREKNLLLPTALSIAGGVLKVPAMLFAHFFHYYLRQK